MIIITSLSNLVPNFKGPNDYERYEYKNKKEDFY